MVRSPAPAAPCAEYPKIMPPGTIFRLHPRLWCCTSTTLFQHLAGIKGRARIKPEAEGTLVFAHGLRGNCMGGTLLLLSCGAAFITGLVIAAASLFG